MANSREERKQRSLGFNYNLYSKEKKAKKWTSTPTSMGIIDQIQNKIFVLKKYILIKKINYFNNN